MARIALYILVILAILPAARLLRPAVDVVETRPAAVVPLAIRG